MIFWSLDPWPSWFMFGLEAPITRLHVGASPWLVLAVDHTDALWWRSSPQHLASSSLCRVGRPVLM